MDALPSIKQPGGERIRMALAVGLAKDHPSKGRQILEEFPDGVGRWFGFKSFEEAAILSPDDRMDLLAQMIQESRGTQNPEYRVIGMGLAAERLIDIGQRETGEQLLREAFEDAKKLNPVGWSAFARGGFAEEMCQVDVDAAMQLIDPLKESDSYNRHLQNMAHELAAIDPATAEKMLAMFRTPGQSEPASVFGSRNKAAIRVCYRMIRTDAERAQRLARSITSESMRVYAFRVMAESLLTIDPLSEDSKRLARKLHDEAWGLLTKIRTQEDVKAIELSYQSVIAAGLCNITKSVAPNQLRHRVWQAIALRRPMESEGRGVPVGHANIAETALHLRTADREMAKQLMLWVPSPEQSSAFARFQQACRNSAAVIAEFSPDSCEAVLAAVPKTQTEQQAVNLITALLRFGEQKERSIRSNSAMWYPDDEDMGPLD